MPNLQSYTGLITSEHANQPNFVALVTALVQPLLDAQSLFGDLIEVFDVDTAVGAQLDAVGQWVGISRQIAQPISGVYFSLDTQGLGFDQGVWLGPFDPTTGIVALPDDIYRSLINAKIIMNSWDGTVGTIARAINALFAGQPTTQVVVIDNQDMTMTIGIGGNAPASISLSLLEGGYIPIKPSGVLLKYLVTSVNQTPLFGFDIENTAISGFNEGAFGGQSGATPGQVLGVGAVSITATTVKLSWLPDAVGSGPFTYQVQYQLTSAPGIWILVGLPVFQTQISVTGLSPNTSYGFQVYPINTTGPGLPSNTLTVTTAGTTPNVVTGVTSLVTAPTTVSLSWNPVPDLGGTSYQVQSRVSGSSTFSNLGPPTTSTISDVSGLEQGVSYDFAVYAINVFGIGPLSSAVTVAATGTVPGLVQNFFVGTVGSNAVQLVWTQPNTDNGPYTYTVQFAQNVNPATYQTFTGTTTTTGDISVTNVTGLQPGTNYLFRVFATNASGNGPNAISIPATTLAASTGQVPTLTIGVIAATTVGLVWTAAVAATTYQMQYQVAGSQLWTNSGSPGAGLSGTVTGLTAGTAYNFEVYGISATSVVGPPSPIASATTTGSVPSQVTGLVASAPTFSSVTLVWAASTGAPTNIVYQAQYKVTGSTIWNNFGAPIPGLTVIVSGLQSGQSYDFQVFGKNDTGVGTASAPVTLATTVGTTISTTWNSSDHTPNIVLSNNNLVATSLPQIVNGLGVSNPTTTSYAVSWASPNLLGFFGVRGTKSYSAGKFYLEYGITTDNQTFAVGLANSFFDFNTAAGLGWDVNGLGIFPRNQSAFINGIQLTVEATTTDLSGDTVSVAYDFDNKLFWFTTQAMRSALGVNTWNGNTAANPATGIGGLSMGNLLGACFPAFNSTVTSCSCTINCGASAFVIALPAGFTAWNGSGVVPVNPPSQVTGLVAGTATSSSIPLTWTVPTAGGAVNYYNVNFRKTGTSAWYFGPTTTQTNCVIINLLSSTSYDIEVNATGPGGAGVFSTVTTAGTVPAIASVLTYRGLNISGSDLTKISTIPASYPHVNAVIIPVFCSTANQTSTDVALTVTIATIAGWVDAANAAGLEVFLGVSLAPRDGSPGATVTPGPSLAATATFFQNLQSVLVQVAQMGSAHSAIGMWCTGVQPWAGAAADTGPYSATNNASWHSIYVACKAVWTNGIIAYSAPQTAIGLAQPLSAFSADWFLWDAIVFDIFPGSNNSYLTITQFETFFDTQPDPDPNTQAATGNLPLFQALVTFAQQQGRKIIINSCGIIPAVGNQFAPRRKDALPPPFDFTMQSAWWVSVLSEITKNVGVFAGFFAYDGGTNGFNSPYMGIDYYGFGSQPAGGNIDTVYSGLTGVIGGGGLAAPTNLNVSGQTSSSLVLSWNGIAGPSITYVPQISLHGANSFTSLTAILGTSATFTGLSPNTAYDLRVFAQQGALLGPLSIIVVGTTLPTTGGQPTITITTPAIPVASSSTFTVSGTLSGFATAPQLYYIDDGAVAPVTGITLTSATGSSLAVSWGAIAAATQIPISFGTTTTSFSFTHPGMSNGTHSILITNGTVTASKPYVVGFVVSPDRTVILAGSNAVITDNGGNAWGISSGNQVLINGAIDSTSASCVEIAWVSGIIWYENSSNQWRSRSSPTAAWSAPTNISPLGGAQIVTVSVPSGIQANSTFVVSGTLTGYSTAPSTLVYQDDSGTQKQLPAAATITATAYSFTHPVGLPVGNHTLTVTDTANAQATASTGYTITNGTIVPISHPLTGATVGTWQTATITANGITTTYLYLLPFNYSGTQFSYPLALYLHSTENLTAANIQTELNNWVNTASWRNNYPCIVLAPIMSSADFTSGTFWGGFTTAASASGANAIALVQQFVNTFSVTNNQTFTFGYETGAVGCWDFAVKYNRQTGTLGKLLDAFMPVGGSLFTAGSPSPTSAVITALTNVPIFGIFGASDTLISSTWETNLYAAYGGGT